MRALIALITFLAAVTAGLPLFAAPLGEPGTSATYTLQADPSTRPRFERDNRLTVLTAVIRLGPVVDMPGRGMFQWYGLRWVRANGQSYQMWALLDRWPAADDEPQVARYLWKEPDWPDSVQFVHEVTGKPVLPRLSLWSYGWPQKADTVRAPASGMPERILLHGWPLKRTGLGREPVTPPTSWKTVKLNPDLLIGWTSKDRDSDGRPHYRLPDGYRYQPKSDEDLMAHIRAGSNFFVGRPESESMSAWLARSSVFHGSLAKVSDWPAILYRPNYWGMMNHHDEPALGNLGRKGTPAEAAEGLQKILSKAARPTGINESLSGRFGLGSLSIEENDNPTWEVLWETAWYQLAMPNVGGIVDEDTKMEGAGVLVDLYNMAFGTHIPNTIENSCAIRTAVMRGAARNFGKRWGVGFYEPDAVKIRSAEIPHFYDRGATYFWAWTGWVGIADNSGLPYPYQRQYFSLVREAFNRNPDRDMQALLRAAKVAVVIPYGYTFSPWHMHRTVWLPLEKTNANGVTFRQVLTNAATEVERLIRLGIDFDIAVDDPLFQPRGYDELVYCREDGTVRIVRPGSRDLLRSGPRAVERPDLGPPPRLSIRVDGTGPYATGEIRFTAVAEIGTGDWAGETPGPTVYWEVYDGESIIELTYSALWPPKGLEMSHKFEKPGTYTVRASAADVFGRPAVAYRTIEVVTASARR